MLTCLCMVNTIGRSKVCACVQAREEFFWEGVNKECLRTIEKASFVMVLEHRDPADVQEQCKMLMHNDGKTLWFDKSVSAAGTRIVGRNWSLCVCVLY